MKVNFVIRKGKKRGDGQVPIIIYYSITSALQFTLSTINLNDFFSPLYFATVATVLQLKIYQLKVKNRFIFIYIYKCIFRICYGVNLTVATVALQQICQRFQAACFFACFFGGIIWKRFKIFVPLHCQRKKTKFAACLGNKNYLRARHLFLRQSQKWSHSATK